MNRTWLMVVNHHFCWLEKIVSEGQPFVGVLSFPSWNDKQTHMNDRWDRWDIYDFKNGSQHDLLWITAKGFKIQ